MGSGGASGRHDHGRRRRQLKRHQVATSAPFPIPCGAAARAAGIGGRAATSAGGMISGGNRKARPARQQAGHRAARHGNGRKATSARPQRTAKGGNMAGGKAGNGPQRAASWTVAAANFQRLLNPKSWVGRS